MRAVEGSTLPTCSRYPVWSRRRIPHRPRLRQFKRQPQGNSTGLSDGLKDSLESLSGESLDDVQVHRNSSEVARQGAAAFAQGTDIHLGPGQERRLAHEAWHVVQQKQGRVQAQRRLASGASVNEDPALEHEADLMGARARSETRSATSAATSQFKRKSTSTGPVQFYARWYQKDASGVYHPRWVSVLPWGWIPAGTHLGKPAYISMTDLASSGPVQSAEVAAEALGLDARGLRRNLEHAAGALEEVVFESSESDSRHPQETTPLLVSSPRVEGRLEAARAGVLSFQTAFESYVRKNTSYVKILMAFLGIGVVGGGVALLSLVTIPWQAVASIDGLSLIYGSYMLFRWSRSEMIPTLLKVLLLLGNGAAMSGAIGSTLYSVVGYLSGLIATAPLQHVHLAALPFAMLVEQALVRFLEKVRRLQLAYNNRVEGDEDDLEGPGLV